MTSYKNVYFYSASRNDQREYSAKPHERSEYPLQFPKVGDLIVGIVTSTEEFGLTLSLPEYNNRQAMILFSEVTKKPTKAALNIKDGARFIVQVISVDPIKG